MMKLTKKFAVIFLTVLMIFSLAGISASAATTTQDGLEVTLTTDKTEYTKNEQITATLKVKNTNSETVSNVTLETVVPTGFKVADNASSAKSVGTLNGNAEEQLTVKLVKDDSGDSTIKSPKTGEETDYLAIILVLVISGIAVFVAVKSKKKIQVLSLVLGVLIFSQVAMPLNLHVYADEVHKTATTSVIVKMDGNDVEIIGKASYDLGNGESQIGDLKADETFFLVNKESRLVFSIGCNRRNANIQLYKNDQQLVGTMNDEGVDGDKYVNDGVYTLAINDYVNSSTTIIDRYYVKSDNSESNNVLIYYLTQNDIEETDRLVQEIDDRISSIESQFTKSSDETENVSSAINTFNHVLDYISSLKSEGKVLYYSVDDNVVTIRLLAANYVYVFDLLDSYQDKIPSSLNASSSTINTTVSQATHRAWEVLSAQPYANDLNSNVFDNSAQTIQNSLEQYSFANNADNDTVSIDFMKHLSRYKVIIWDGHGGYSNTLHSFIGTGESSTNAGNRYAEDLIGVVSPIIYLRGGNLGITSEFITKYYNESSFDNTIIYLGCCHGADDNVLADSLINCGVSTVLGYRHSVYVDYNRNMCTSIFNSLTQVDGNSGLTTTVNSALTQAKNNNGSTDPTKQHWWNKVAVFFGWENYEEPAELVVIGDLNYRLSDSIRISGTITNADNTLLSNTKILLYDNNRNLIREYDSADGLYSFNVGNTVNNNYTIKFEKEGYITQTKSIIDVAEDRTLDVTMQKDTNNPNIPADAPTFNGHTYYLYTGYTWQEAKEYCESVGGHLATITSQEEMDFIINDLESKSEKANCYWIGLQRDGDSWKWITDEPFSYSNWAENEPNNYEDHGENVVHLFGKEYTEGKGTKRVGTWNDVTNEGAEYAADFYALQNFGYICEWDSVNKTDALAYSQYFALEPVVSSYGSELVDEYGARLQLNDGAVIRKCAVYMYQDGSTWYRTIAFVGDNITSATYLPYVAYQGNLLYDGTNHSGINTLTMHESSDGIWNYYNKDNGDFAPVKANLKDSNGNYLTFRSKDVVGRNVQIFDNLDDMKSWLLS